MGNTLGMWIWEWEDAKVRILECGKPAIFVDVWLRKMMQLGVERHGMRQGGNMKKQLR